MKFLPQKSISKIASLKKISKLLPQEINCQNYYQQTSNYYVKKDIIKIILS